MNHLLLSLKSLCLPGKTLVLKSILVAYVSLNGLTRDLRQISINVSLSQRVTQKVKAARCLFKIKLIDGTFIHFISEVSQSIFFVVRSF